MDIGVFKLYLGRILGTFREETDSMSGPLCYYQENIRTQIGKVLMQSDQLGPPGSYVPLFYQNGLSNAAKSFSLVQLINFRGKVYQNCSQQQSIIIYDKFTAINLFMGQL